MDIHKILEEYVRFTDRPLKLIRNICSSVPSRIDNKSISIQYYGTDYFHFYNRDTIWKSYKDGINLRFCQIGYRVITNNEFFGFESKHEDMFYILFCFLQDSYVLVIRFIPENDPYDPYRYRIDFTPKRLITIDENKKLRYLKVISYSVMETSDFFKYLKNPIK